jgi:hypothetical protein
MLSLSRLLCDLPLLHIPAASVSAAAEGKNPEDTDEVEWIWRQQYAENDVEAYKGKCLPSCHLGTGLIHHPDPRDVALVVAKTTEESVDWIISYCENW